MKRDARSNRRRFLGPALLGIGMVGGGACGESAPIPPPKAASFRGSSAKAYAEGRAVQSFGVGDVDGDGHLDVVLNDVNRFAILRGDGAGALANNLLDGGPTVSSLIAVADVTGDGRADVMGSAVGSGNVRIFPGRADGTFGPSIAYGVPTQVISRLAVVDLTGDGAPDVLIQAPTFPILQASTGFLAVLPNRGNGVFDEPLLTPFEVDPLAMTTADLNGDGATDVAIVDGRNLMTQVLFNDGRGHLSAPQPAADTATGTGPIFSGDFDGDGWPDLLRIVGANSDQLSILRNVGGGGFQSLPLIDLGTFASDLVTADLDNDGRTDVAALISNGAIATLRADGVTLTGGPVYATGGSATLLQTGDFDHDGAVDLVVANGTSTGGNVTVLRNDGRGLFDAVPLYPAAGEAWTTALGDVTGDGLTDIVLSAGGLEGPPSLVVFAAAARGTSPVRPTPIPIPGAIPGLAVGDLNNDRIADVVVASQEIGQTMVLLGTAGGQLAPPMPSNVSFGTKVAIGDLDGDAFLDLAVSSVDVAGQIDLFSNQGNGTFRPLQTYHAGDNSVTALQIADVNGDGRLDVVSALPDFDGTGVISLLFSSGQRGFAAPIEVTLVPAVDALVLTDLDRDGRADVVGSSTASSEVPLLFGAPRGRPFVRKSFDIGTITAGVVSADFNQDGWPDLAFPDQIGGNVVVTLNDRHGGFPDRQVIPLQVELRDLQAGDLNGDGKVDLAAVTTAGVVVLWNTTE